MAEVKTYHGADEPTDMAPGTTWRKDDGKEFARKPDGTWVQTGRWTERNCGHVDIQGDTMLGPLLGQHGLAPLDSPPFTGMPTISGGEIATKTWTTDQLSDLQKALQDFISGQFSGSEGSITIGNNLAIGYGTRTNGQTIPLPVYGDKSNAFLTEVWAVMVSPADMGGSISGDIADIFTVHCSVDSSLLLSCYIKHTRPGWGNDDIGIGDSGHALANYFIVCKR